MLKRCGALVLLAAVLGLAIYCFLSLVLGPSGLVAYTQLRETRASMRENLAALEGAHEALLGELESLRSDRDRIAREARSLGYVGDREYELVLPRLGASQDARPDPGYALPFKKPSSWPDAAIKLIAASLAAAWLLVRLAGGGLRSYRSKRDQRASRV